MLYAIRKRSSGDGSSSSSDSGTTDTLTAICRQAACPWRRQTRSGAVVCNIRKRNWAARCPGSVPGQTVGPVRRLRHRQICWAWLTWRRSADVHSMMASNRPARRAVRTRRRRLRHHHHSFPNRPCRRRGGCSGGVGRVVVGGGAGAVRRRLRQRRWPRRPCSCYPAVSYNSPRKTSAVQISHRFITHKILASFILGIFITVSTPPPFYQHQRSLCESITLLTKHNTENSMNYIYYDLTRQHEMHLS